MKKKLVRITTIPLSLKYLLGGQLGFMNQHFDVTAISSPGVELDELESEGINIERVYMTRKITPLQDLRALMELYRIFKKIKPNIVHTHTPKAGLLGMLAAKMAGVPVRLHTVAGLPLMEREGMERSMLEGIEKLTYSLAHRVYPNSQGLKGFILDKKLAEPNRVEVLANGSSNGINSQFFDLNDEIEKEANSLKTYLKLNEGEVIFLFVGRLVADKGINELIKAFDSLSRNYSNSRLILVGSMEEDLDPISGESLMILKRNKRIIQTGFKKDIRPYLHLSNIFVLPTYREGFPNVVLQAGCLHLPCIVTDINGCNEIIEDGVNGLIIPPKSTERLQNAMIKLLNQQELRKQMASQARAMVVRRYEQNVVWDSLLEEYQRFLSQNVAG
ncbi:glycosyltransferase family 4 protein [Peijinzhouia sedimentorum]